MSYSDIMAGLKKKYLEDLKVKSEDFFNKPAVLDNLEELRTFFHQLKGSGATYGIPEVSEVGKKYEEKVKANDFSKEDLIQAEKEISKIMENHFD